MVPARDAPLTVEELMRIPLVPMTAKPGVASAERKVDPETVRLDKVEVPETNRPVPTFSPPLAVMRLEAVTDPVTVRPAREEVPEVMVKPLDPLMIPLTVTALLKRAEPVSWNTPVLVKVPVVETDPFVKAMVGFVPPAASKAKTKSLPDPKVVVPPVAPISVVSRLKVRAVPL